MKRQKLDDESALQRDGSDSASDGGDKGDSDGSADLEKPKRGGRYKRKRSRFGRRETAASRRAAKTVGPLLYTPGEMLPELEPHIGSQLNVHILAKYLTTENDQVQKTEIWGTGPYSDDSDIVCMLQHSGMFAVQVEPPSFYALAATLRILPGMDSYKGSEKNQMKSKSWSHHAVSLSVESVQIIETEDEITKDLIARSVAEANENGASNGQASEGTTTASYDGPEEPKPERKTRNFRARKEAAQTDSASQGSIDVEVSMPFTRGRKQAAEAEQSSQNRLVLPKDTFLVWNLSNEACFKYSFPMICDRGTSPTQWTSFRLRSAALFLETDEERYEVSLHKNASESDSKYDTYRFARVKDPGDLSKDELSSSICVPLPSDRIHPIAVNLDWSDFSWGQNSVKVKGIEYHIKKLWWQSRFTPRPQDPFSALFNS